jgi:hypothetical protein
MGQFSHKPIEIVAPPTHDAEAEVNGLDPGPPGQGEKAAR